MVSYCRAKQSGQVDDHGDRLSNLRQSECSDIAEGSNHSCWRDGAKMLTLRSPRNARVRWPNPAR